MDRADDAAFIAAPDRVRSVGAGGFEHRLHSAHRPRRYSADLAADVSDLHGRYVRRAAPDRVSVGGITRAGKSADALQSRLSLSRIALLQQHTSPRRGLCAVCRSEQAAFSGDQTSWTTGSGIGRTHQSVTLVSGPYCHAVGFRLHAPAQPFAKRTRAPVASLARRLVRARSAELAGEFRLSQSALHVS